MATTVEASRKESAMWLLERIVPGTGVNNVPTAFEVDGRLDRAVLARALTAVVDRHDVLRTVFAADDTTLTKQVLEPGEATVAVGDIPVTGAGRDADLTAFAGAPFALRGEPLVRAGVWAGPDTDVCCVVVHHLVFDAMSTTILLRELLAAYEAGGTAAPGRVTPPAQRPADERSLAYWRDNLDGLAPSASGLWCAKPAGPTSSLRAETIHHALSADARAAVRRLRKELRASEAVVLLAAYYVLLAQHGAGSDVVIGTPVNVRDQSSMNAIGYHANLLPLRVKLDAAADFRAVAKQTRGTFLEAISNAGVPLEQVSPAVLGDTPSAWRSSFFRHLFNYVPGTVDTSATVGGLPVRHVMVENGYSRFDLEFFIMPGAEQTTVRAAYCVDAFDGGDVALLLERYDALLAALGRDSADDTVPALPVAALSRWGATDHAVLTPAPAGEPVPGTVLDRVHAVVSARPDAVAVEEVARVVTYGELWSAALDTRDLVAERGAATVALIAPRSAELAAAWLGCWLAGAACVLLDPAQPPADLADRVTDAGAPLVLMAPGLPVPGGVPIAPIAGAGRTGAPETGAEAPAYLEYPLDATVAMVVGHRALATAVADLPPDTVSLWLSSVATNASLVEALSALTTGGRVVVSPDRARTDGQLLGDLLDRHRVGLVQAPAAVWRQVFEQAGARLTGRTVLTSAEPSGARLATQLRAAGADVRTGYTTPGAAGHLALDTGQVFVTEPGTTHELGIGVRGELCVAGDAVATGCHDRPALTGERFGEHPVHGRFYRTGELARWLPDGRIELSGPLSATVTAGGQRVHLSHVEAVLAECPDVDAVVAVGDGEAVTAFVESRKPDVADRLPSYARAALPFVPALVVLDALPLTLASTVDRAALAGLAESVRERDGAAPPDETTSALVAIWAELLDRPALHADSNFFASGGHSLLGAQLVQRVKTGLGLPVALADLFANPTPRELAAHLQNAVWDDDLDDDDFDDLEDDFDDED